MAGSAGHRLSLEQHIRNEAATRTGVNIRMSTVRDGEDDVDRDAESARFAVRSIVGLGGVLAAGVLFSVALALVSARWGPLRVADRTVVGALNDAVSPREWVVTLLHFITDLGGAQASWLLIPLTGLWLLGRGLRRLAVYVAVTGAGAAVLSAGTKALVDRVRPVVDVPIASAPDPSFPSGHALGSTVTYGVLLLVFLPVVPVRFRRVVEVAVLTLVILIGVTRVALGVHYPSDVIGGWALGALWLAITAAAFRRWHEEEGLGRPPVEEGLEPEERRELAPAPMHESMLPDGWRSASQILVGAVVIWGALVGVGVLITDVFNEMVRPVDVSVVEWFAAIRTDALSTLAVLVGHLGGTIGIVVVLAIAVPLALALTRRWAPSAFLLIAVVGETALFLAVSTIISRGRPPVEHLSPPLPPTSSFPSGHVAAATAAYGAIALLVRAWVGGWIGRVALAVAAVASGSVALSRLYRGVHYPTDVLASIVYACAWLAICWWALRPGRGSPTADPSNTSGRPRPTGSDSSQQR